MRQLIILCCAALSLAGCGVYDTYHRRQSVPADLYGADSLHNDIADTAGIASLPWRELFTDRRLQALIDSGLANNSDLRVASLRVREAEATLRASRLAYLPSLAVAPQGQMSSFDGAAAAKTYSLALSAQWELDIAGRITNPKRAAAATVEMNRAYRQAVQTQLVATIANSYYNLLTLDAQLAISRRTLENWKETVRALKVQKEVGEANEAAVSQAEADLQQVEGNVLTLKGQISEQENAISQLLGTVPHTVERGSLEAQVFPDKISTGVPLRILDRRPDVRQAEYALQRAFYATNSARAAFYPQATLSGTLGWANSDGASIVNPGKWLWNAIGSITQPLFNRGENRANLEVAKAQQEEAASAFRQSLMQAGAEVNNALVQWQTAQKRLKIDSAQVAALRTTVAGTRLLQSHSDGKTYLEVLTAQQALLQAELTEKQDIFAKIQGIINLYHALGGGAD